MSSELRVESGYAAGCLLGELKGYVLSFVDNCPVPATARVIKCLCLSCRPAYVLYTLPLASFTHHSSKFPEQEVFADMLRSAGFAGVAYEDLTFGIAAIHSGFKL